MVIVEEQAGEVWVTVPEDPRSVDLPGRCWSSSGSPPPRQNNFEGTH
jgi:hypothetical protein